VEHANRVVDLVLQCLPSGEFTYRKAPAVEPRFTITYDERRAPHGGVLRHRSMESCLALCVNQSQTHVAGTAFAEPGGSALRPVLRVPEVSQMGLRHARSTIDTRQASADTGSSIDRIWSHPPSASQVDFD
jgi:hypothetical protein